MEQTISPPTPSPRARTQPPRLLLGRSIPDLLLCMAILAYALYFANLTLTRYWAFEARALDLGNFNQAIWNTAHGNWFHLTNQEGVVNRLSLHVEPILIPVSWLYWIHDGPETLLLLQAVVVSLGALPLYALARHLLGNEWLALTFAAAFLLNPSMQAANWLEFHAVTLAPTFLLAAFYYLYTNRPGRFALFAVLAASCKEEMALLLFMLGLYTFLVLQRRRWGSWTMLLATAWALIAVFGIQNLFAAGNIHWNRYGYLGDSPLQMVLTLLTRPDVVWNQLVAAHALAYVARLLLGVGFLALLAPEVLLLALPSLAINLLADFPPMHQVDTLIYAAPIVPFVMVGGVMGARRIGVWLAPIKGDERNGINGRARKAALEPPLSGEGGSAAIHAPTGIPPRSSINTDDANSNPSVFPPIRVYKKFLPALPVGLLVFVCAIVDQQLHGYLPWSGNYLPLQITQHHRNAAQIIAQIPPDARVSAQDRLDPHVSGRETIYLFPRVEDADTIFLDVTGPAWPQHPSDLRRTVDELMAQGFGVAAALDGYLLLRKGEPNRTLPATFYDAWRVDNFQPQNSVAANFGDELRLLDVRVARDRYGELVVQTFWQPLRTIDRAIRFYIGYLDRAGAVLYDTQFYPPVANLWYPTDLWQSQGGNQAFLVQTLPWTLDVDRFTLVLGAFDAAIDSDWYNGERLPVTAAPPTMPVLENGALLRLGGFERDASGNWQPVAPDAAKPVRATDARFGDQIVLDGVTPPALANRAITFTLAWRATAPLPDDYTAFVHLLDAADKNVAQLDWQPHDALGLLPTSHWIVGQPVVDTQTLPLPDALPPGEYRLIAGLYRWQDGTRLPVTGADALSGDVVEVGKIRIESDTGER
ncbi:MAG: DUF2079 domain-containing protein [Caldilineaceae bacterium]